MKHTTTLPGLICNYIISILSFKKTALSVLLLCCMANAPKAQSHEDTTIVLERNSFTVSVIHTPEGLLKIEMVNNLGSAIGPFFMETNIKGFNLNEGHIVQHLNDLIVTENTERIFGPQFMGLGLISLPAYGNYKTVFATESKTNEAPAVQIRISGTMNGQHVIWSNSYNF